MMSKDVEEGLIVRNVYIIPIRCQKQHAKNISLGAINERTYIYTDIYTDTRYVPQHSSTITPLTCHLRHFLPISFHNLLSPLRTADNNLSLREIPINVLRSHSC